MILRRMADAIRTQNWFTVIIEFLLVITGVLVALQVDTWNNERQNRVEERRLASQLLSELTTTIETKNAWIEEIDTQRKALEGAIFVVQDTDPNAHMSDEQCTAAWASHIIVFTTSQLATLDEILSTGGVRTLKDKNLRDTLLAFSDTRKRAAANLALIRIDFANLIDNYPDAFPRTLTRTSPDTSNNSNLSISSEVVCDLSLIRATPAIRNKLISNLGRTTGAIDTAREEVVAMENLKIRLSETSQ
ncbi:hypothetical protein [Kordiimonas aquimaris]|uniref:hypothetical protein n=1 Tax=Kordiimonas aquimaris TaxID=707591 RepID=UPI0021CFB0C1|nr:hypothetical protein [Kordiimonas aquimaris]